MEHNQEKYARGLHAMLEHRFAPVSAQTEITISGAVVNWDCFIKRGIRSCRVHCFDARGPEFLTYFKQEEEDVAIGRTPAQTETVDAVWHWLDGKPQDFLYERFRFVDWQKRELTRIQDLIVRDFPGLAYAASVESAFPNSDLYNLWFRTGTRSAILHFYGKDEVPRAIFHWDQCELFRFRAEDTPVLAGVLQRWLGEDAPPSSMRKEFPWLQIGKLADYYENGNPIEGEFLESWDRIEEFYRSNNFGPQDLVLRFLAALRRGHYDRQLRAGQSMSTCILSRSRRHGLREDQPSVCFEFHFHEGTMNVLFQIPGEKRAAEMRGIAIALSNQVQEELTRLVKQPIN